MTYNNCKAQAIEDLKNYNYLKSSLITLPKRIETMKICAPTLSAANGASPEHNGQAANYLSHIEHLENVLAANQVKVSCMDTALSALSMRDKELLSVYYINRQRNTVTNLAMNSFSDRSSIYRRAQRALKNYILAYFGELMP